MKKHLLLRLFTLVIGVVFVISGIPKMVDSSKFIGIANSIEFKVLSYIALFVSTLDLLFFGLKDF